MTTPPRRRPTLEHDAPHTVTRRIERHGFGPQPPRWVEAAASAAARGEVYVVSVASGRAMDEPGRRRPGEDEDRR